MSLLPESSMATASERRPVGQFTSLASWESQDGVTASTTNSFVGNFTKMQGNHTIRFGPEFRVYRESRNRYGATLSPQYALQHHLREAQRHVGRRRRAAASWPPC